MKRKSGWKLEEKPVERMKYRAEIDGLRAIAVITVIMFHAGFKYFRGGYIGVDIFFVISGYLITTIILSELDRGTFSLVTFYERRARRIMPALFTVLLASFICAWLWLVPADMKDFSRSLIAVLSFSSNILFRQTSGYWDTANELRPLLHTWSLAVEEQFYILFPYFLVLMSLYRKRWIFGSFMIIAAISLTAAQWGAYNEPEAAFYLLPTRAWELAIGAGLSYYFLYREQELQTLLSQKRLSEVMSLVGLSMIVYAVICFDEKTPFPGLYALLPTLGTGLIILFSSSKTLTGRLLSAKPLVTIGLISYSAYLWHQPLFAFARYRSIFELSELSLSALALLSFMLAYLSWRFVEQPFRNKIVFDRPAIFLFALIGSAVLIIVGFLGFLSKGFESRLTDNQKEIMAFEKYAIKEIYREETCLLNEEQKFTDFAVECFYPEQAAESILIWGDSHAAALSFGMRKNHPAVAQLTASGCVPLIGYSSISRPNCQDINNGALDKIEELKPQKVILHANWSAPLDQIKPGLDQALLETVSLIKLRSPSSQIVIVGGVPKWKPTLPKVLLKSHVELTDEAFVYSNLYDEIKKTDVILYDVANENHVLFISLLDIFCLENNCLSSMALENKYEPFAWDYGHLTKSASIIVSQKVLELSGNR